MTHLYEIVDHDDLLLALNDGYIREQSHPEYPELRILNYTEKAQYERHWNATIRLARGLIYNADTFEVLARPFPKIHNWDEVEAPNIVDNQWLYAWSNKYDGSLGILYRLPNGMPQIATRGSFASEQAIEATKMLHNSGMAWVFDEYIDSGYTPLFEIIYPENRIVLNYGTERSLVKLGYIHIETGAYVPNEVNEPRTMHDLLMDLSRENAEGWVAWLTPYKAVKIKQADYVELHRIVTGLNRKSVWTYAQQGPAAFNRWAENLPDELHKWAAEIFIELWGAYGARMQELDKMYLAVLDEVHSFIEPLDRKQFAQVAQRIAGKDAGYMFSILDNKDIYDRIWRELEPKGDTR